ncbi:hypothetical protein D9C73_003583 [Collichthys lucidus]|uniref:Uncharacterized protein n=1 Tax=Collichthys lucidus TaxID=240159 RepID=A0A4U5U6R2_COLLU|nr:hypothetical protein D9C73_003583 [Collichthys lucidus]
MAPSVSGMKMRNLLFGVILGLLAVVHSTPVNTVTQNPFEAEDDFFREAMTDGFLIDQSLPTLLTTESLPKKQTDDSSSNSSTTQIPQSGVTASPVANETQTEESNIPDGSGDEGFQIGVEHYTTTTQSVTHIQSTTSAVLPRDTDSDSSTTQISQSDFTSSLAVNEGSGDWIMSIATTTQSVSHGESSSATFLEMDTEESSLDSSTTQIPQSDFTSLLAVNEGSGDWIMSIATTTQSVSHVESSTALEMDTEESSSDSSTTQIPQSDFTSSLMLNEAQSTESNVPYSSTSSLLPRNFHDIILESSNKQNLHSSFTEDSEDTTMAMTTTSTQNDIIKQGRIVDVKEGNQAEQLNTAHGTPSWIIIVGFIVGVAALVMLCVAIATRDKWNGPSQASQLETNTNSTNQQRGQELETFLYKDSPRENGKAAEYTVIPLDELSESYSSH